MKNLILFLVSILSLNASAQISIDGPTTVYVNTPVEYVVLGLPSNAEEVTYSWNAHWCGGLPCSGSSEEFDITWDDTFAPTNDIVSVTVNYEITTTNSSGQPITTSYSENAQLNVNLKGIPQSVSISGPSIIQACSAGPYEYELVDAGDADQFTWTYPTDWVVSGQSTNRLTVISAPYPSSGSVCCTLRVTGAPSTYFRVPCKSVSSRCDLGLVLTPSAPSLSCGSTTPFTVTASAGTCAVNYIWNITGGTFTGSGQVISVTPNCSSANVVVNCTVTRANCTSATATKIISKTLSQSHLNTPVSICRTSTGTFSAVGNPCATYSWSIPAGFSSRSLVGTSLNLKPLPTVAEGNYIVTVTAVGCGQTVSQTKSFYLAVTAPTGTISFNRLGYSCYFIPKLNSTNSPSVYWPSFSQYGTPCTGCVIEPGTGSITCQATNGCGTTTISRSYNLATPSNCMWRLSNSSDEVENEEDTNPVKLYPNPVTNEFTLEFNLDEEKQVNFAIYDIQGRLVDMPINTQRLFSAGEVNRQINVENLNAGLYVYRLTIGEQVLTGKFIKE